MAAFVEVCKLLDGARKFLAREDIRNPPELVAALASELVKQAAGVRLVYC